MQLERGASQLQKWLNMKIKKCIQKGKYEVQCEVNTTWLISKLHDIRHIFQILLLQGHDWELNSTQKHSDNWSFKYNLLLREIFDIRPFQYFNMITTERENYWGLCWIARKPNLMSKLSFHGYGKWSLIISERTSTFCSRAASFLGMRSSWQLWLRIMMKESVIGRIMTWLQPWIQIIWQ